MTTTIISQTSKKGIQPTTYEALANFNIDENKVSIIEMKNKLLSIDKNIGFSHVIPNTMNFHNEVTKVWNTVYWLSIIISIFTLTGKF